MIHWWSLLNNLLRLLLSFLLCGSVAAADPASDDANYKTKSADLETLRTQIDALRANLQKTHGQHDAVNKQLQVAEQDIARFSQELAQRDTELQMQTKRLAELQTARQLQQDALIKQRAALSAQMRATYVIGRQQYLKALLNQQNPATIGRSLIYYDYFNRARTQHISGLAAELAQVDALELTVKQQLAEVAKLSAAQRDGKQALEDSQQRRRQLLAQLGAEIQNKNQELQRLIEDQRQLEELLPKLQQALANVAPEPGDRKPFVSLKGELSWPVIGPILNSYGSPRMEGAMKWQGVVIGARAGQQVQAVSYGRVAFADLLRGFGLLMIIDHGDGYMSLYGQNQSLGKITGDWVEAGDVIANVGSSAADSSAGLYFEIRHQGEPSNPALWCKKEVQK
ncbi:MAG: peptidoglycan DD-metalloendopeptidase family protein [Gammaproteobacteria bacterium]